MEGVGWSEQSVSSPVPAWAMPPRKYGICFALAYADLDVERTSRLYGMTSMSLRSQKSRPRGAGALTSLRIPVGIVTQLPTRLVFFSLSWGKLGVGVFCPSFWSCLVRDVAGGSFEALIWLELLVDLCQSIQPLSCSTHASEERKGTEQNLAQLPLTHNRGEILQECE